MTEPASKSSRQARDTEAKQAEPEESEQPEREEKTHTAGGQHGQLATLIPAGHALLRVILDYAFSDAEQTALDARRADMRKAPRAQAVLVAAAANGWTEKVEKLLREKPRLDTDAALDWAAHGGHVETMQQLMKKGATSINSALRNAAIGGHMPAMWFLTNKGATQHSEALFWASAKGHTAAIAFCLMKGKGITGKEITEALDRTLHEYHLEAMAYLVKEYPGLKQHAQEIARMYHYDKAREKLEAMK